MDALLIVIPAIKKSVAFPDDLVKKLAGVTLIQRTITIASEVAPRSQVLIVTDSEEIDLICRRQNVSVHLDSALCLSRQNITALDVAPYLHEYSGQWQDLLVLSPYVPLLSGAILRKAYDQYKHAKTEYMVPVSCVHAKAFLTEKKTLQESAQATGQSLTVESNAFSIISRSLLEAKDDRKVEAFPFLFEDGLIEIRDYHDWWLCEKLLNRRRIVFRVIGNKEEGMGHIYRCLALAHEISDHEVYFVCDTHSGVAANMLAGYDYWLGVYEPEAIDKAILELEPDLVINDILNTDKKYVQGLKEAGIRVVNFEDLGSGASESEITVNDLYDEPLLSGDNILWGHDWFFLRDEFNEASPHQFQNEVKRILMSFGGTDPSDFTRRILTLISAYCAEHGIGIDVVTGDGYGHIKELEEMILSMSGDVTYTHATGVISQIMETAQLAICANGRTVYELAHMNIPAVVLSHHERESSHLFACEANGFVSVDIKDASTSNNNILKALQRLVEDDDYRKGLFTNMGRHSFVENKRKVVDLLQELLKK